MASDDQEPFTQHGGAIGMLLQLADPIFMKAARYASRTCATRGVMFSEPATKAAVYVSAMQWDASQIKVLEKPPAQPSGWAPWYRS
eukprot:5054369-Amphidinium_carterae.1